MVHGDRLLELSVLSYHRLSPKQVSIKRFTASGGTLGRSEQADWYLPDPERVVSGIHAEISFRQGDYFIVDKSTNGLFVNRAVDALGDHSHQLQSGDILCLGDYEIQVQLIEHAVANNDTTVISALETKDKINSYPAVKNSGNVQSNELGISNVESGFSIKQFTAAPVAEPNHSVTERTNQHANQHANQQTHDLAMDDHYIAPAALIPDDWDSAWSANTAAITTINNPAKVAPTTSKLKPVTNNANNEQTPLTAFMTGLGVSGLDGATFSNQQWQQLGEALQQSILGLIDVMRARSKVKNSFRVNQTTFQQRENNPLKFSATIDEAFHNLFNRPSSSFMPAKQAIAEAIKDIAEHEAAMLAGVAGVSKGLLAQLAPVQFEQADYSQSIIDKIIPAQRQARLWQHYCLSHKNLTTELVNSSNGGVNDDFISAYEKYLANS